MQLGAPKLNCPSEPQVSVFCPMSTKSASQAYVTWASQAYCCSAGVRTPFVMSPGFEQTGSGGERGREGPQWSCGVGGEGLGGRVMIFLQRWGQPSLPLPETRFWLGKYHVPVVIGSRWGSSQLTLFCLSVVSLDCLTWYLTRCDLPHGLVWPCPHSLDPVWPLTWPCLTSHLTPPDPWLTCTGDGVGPLPWGETRDGASPAEARVAAVGHGLSRHVGEARPAAAAVGHRGGRGAPHWNRTSNINTCSKFSEGCGRWRTCFSAVPSAHRCYVHDYEVVNAHALLVQCAQHNKQEAVLKATAVRSPLPVMSLILPCPPYLPLGVGGWGVVEGG